MGRWTQQQYQELLASIAQGAQRVEYADKRIEYKGENELQRLLAEMEADLGIVTSPQKGTRRVGNFSKGL